jgi:hypothetical protein
MQLLLMANGIPHSHHLQTKQIREGETVQTLTGGRVLFGQSLQRSVPPLHRAARSRHSQSKLPRGHQLQLIHAAADGGHPVFRIPIICQQNKTEKEKLYIHSPVAWPLVVWSIIAA